MGAGNRIGANIIRLDNVDSTNAYALRKLRLQTLREGTVILADYQSAGRGQAGNIWQSDAGKNLTFSFVLYPFFLPASQQFLISMAVSNGIVACLQENLVFGKIKWPNDICIGEKKIAGILIENALLNDRIKHCVTGVGLNVNQSHFPADLCHATSMCLASGNKYRIDRVLDALLEQISYRIRQLYDSRFDLIKAFYMDHLQFLDEWRNYADATGWFEGKIVDVADSGELLVARKTGRVHAYAFKEISFRC